MTKVSPRRQLTLAATMLAATAAPLLMTPRASDAQPAVAARTWSAPAPFAPATPPGYQLNGLAVDRKGSVTVAWTRLASRIRLRQRSAAGVLGRELQIRASGALRLESLLAGGTVTYVGWSDIPMRGQRRIFRTGVVTARGVRTVATGGVPVAVNRSGVALLGSRAGRLWIARPGHAPVALADDGRLGYLGPAAIADDGTVAAIVNAYGPGLGSWHNTLRVARPGKPLTTVVPDLPSGQATFATTPDGTIALATRTYARGLEVRQLRPDAATFEEPQTVSGPTRTMMVFDLASTANGTLLASWTMPTTTSHGRVEAAVAPPGGVFGPATVLAADSGFRPGDAAMPRIATDERGNAVIAWLDEASLTGARLRSATWTAGRGFRPGGLVPLPRVWPIPSFVSGPHAFAVTTDTPRRQTIVTTAR